MKLHINTKRTIQRIMNFIDGKFLPVFVLIIMIVMLVHMVIPMLVAIYSEEGEIAKIRRENEKRAYMPAPTQTYYGVE